MTHETQNVACQTRFGLTRRIAEAESPARFLAMELAACRDVVLRKTKAE